MKVTSVEIFDIETTGGELPWTPVIIRANTDEGINGLGEVGLAYGTGHSAGAAMAKNLCENFIIGADPFNTEAIWDKMFRSSFWAQGGGPVVFGGMSAIDTAMWDIKGKALGVPVYKLLGGKTNDNLRTYASQIQAGWDKKFIICKTPEEYAEQALKAVEEGYDCVKVDPVQHPDADENAPNLIDVLSNKSVKLFYNRVKAIRDAVGPDVDIIIELHSLMNATTGVQLGRALEELNCYLYEEPVHYLNVALQEKVSQNVKIPMAAGERLYTRWGYRPYLEKQTLDVIQPDLNLVGGISEGKKICDYAHIYDVRVQCHVCGSPVATASALQLEAAIPNFIIHEHHTIALKDFNIEICKQDYQPENGKYKVPDLPGLSIELNDPIVKKSPCVIVK